MRAKWICPKCNERHVLAGTTEKEAREVKLLCSRCGQDATDIPRRVRFDIINNEYHIKTEDRV